jgi:regulator of sigma E protease
MEVIINLLAFVFSLGLIVALHELGHFFFAKRASILCFEYAVGMGPVIWSTRKGETQYAIRAIPIGGFVSMAGEQDLSVVLKKGEKVGLNLENGEVKDIILGDFQTAELSMIVSSYDLYDKGKQGLFIEGEVDGISRFLTVKKDAFYVFSNKKRLQVAPYERSFESKTLWQRFLTIFAGPAMNFVLAFFLFLIVASIQGKPLNVNRVGNVIEGNPAFIAGLQDNDQIIRIGSVDITNWQDIGTALQSVSGQSDVLIRVVRNNQTIDLMANPRVDINSMGISNFTGTVVNGSNNGAIVGSAYGKANGLLEPGDIITSVKLDDITYPILTWADLVDFARTTNGGSVFVTFTRGTETKTVNWIVWENEVLSSQGVPSVTTTIGIEPNFSFDLGYAITSGFTGIGDSVTQVIAVLGLLFGGSDQIGLNDLSGPVGIFNIVGQYAKQGLGAYLWFIAFLSVNIGVMNLLPIPALDGGRLVFLGIEAVIRRPLNKKVENTANNVMFFLLMALFVYVTFFDILRLF